MKHLLANALRAIAALAIAVSIVSPAFSQRDGLSTSTGGSGTGSLTTPVTKKITVSNDALNVDIKQGSISYQFYATATDGSTTLVKSGQLSEPTNKTSVNDLSLSKPGSKEITLILTANCDGCASVTPVPDASTPSAVADTKEIISQQKVASIDIRTSTNIDYELWTKATPFDDFVKNEKQSGTAPAPRDFNLKDDVVIGDPDAYEIKVVVKTPQGDAATAVSFRDKL